MQEDSLREIGQLKGLHGAKRPETSPSWPNQRLLKLLGIEHPLVLAPMAGVGTVELAAAVCCAGGLGSLGCAGMPPPLVKKSIQDLRARTDRPININFFCHPPANADANRAAFWQDRLSGYYSELGIEPKQSVSPVDISPFNDTLCEVVEETIPEVVSFHFGLHNPHLLERVKATGCRVISSATTVAEALWLESHDADIVIAQGYEAGGHRGTFLAVSDWTDDPIQPGTLALVPQVIDAVRIPVIAAGGISDGRGIAAAFALGAAGVQMGTAYLLCPEAATSSFYRQALKEGRTDSTVVSSIFTGRPARALANRLTSEIDHDSKAMPDFPLPISALTPLWASAERLGRPEFSPFWAGQGFSLGQEMPGEAFTIALAEAALEIFRHLGSKYPPKRRLRRSADPSGY